MGSGSLGRSLRPGRAYIVLHVAVGACRDELRHAELVPILSCQHERCIANLRSRDRPRLRVMGMRNRGGMAGQRGLQI